MRKSKESERRKKREEDRDGVQPSTETGWGPMGCLAAALWGFAAAFIGAGGRFRRLDARTTRPAIGEGKQELVFLDEKDCEGREISSEAAQRFLPFDDCVKWVRAMGLWDSKKEWEEWLGVGMSCGLLEVTFLSSLGSGKRGN
eukprot:Skav215456  [mRNA]  locus=scaffold7336:1217:3930:- [translate_table: standard]